MERFLAGTIPEEGRFGPSVRVCDISEGALIKACMPFLPVGDATIIPSGDDAALISAENGFVVTTDVLIEDSHFRCDWSTAYEVGWRAAAQNLADIAAMGAWPTSIVVGLALPRCLPADWVVECASGIGAYCARYDCGVVGGDITVYAGSRDDNHIVISVAAMGDYRRELSATNTLDDVADCAITRGGAQVGDVIGIVGTVGLSRTGLQVLLDGDSSGVSGQAVSNALTEREKAFMEQCVTTYRCPRPPINTLFHFMAQGRPHAMMDVSDGLLKDAARMAKASDVIMDIQSDALAAFTQPITMLYPSETALNYCLTGGEDHSFLVCLEADVAARWEQVDEYDNDEACVVAENRFIRIGEVIKSRKDDDNIPSHVFVDGVPYRGVQGWDHGADVVS